MNLRPFLSRLLLVPCCLGMICPCACRADIQPVLLENYVRLTRFLPADLQTEAINISRDLSPASSSKDLSQALRTNIKDKPATVPWESLELLAGVDLLKRQDGELKEARRIASTVEDSLKALETYIQKATSLLKAAPLGPDTAQIEESGDDLQALVTPQGVRVLRYLPFPSVGDSRSTVTSYLNAALADRERCQKLLDGRNDTVSIKRETFRELHRYLSELREHIDPNTGILYTGAEAPTLIKRIPSPPPAVFQPIH